MLNVTALEVLVVEPVQRRNVSPASAVAVSVTDEFVAYAFARGFTFTVPLPTMMTVSADWPAGAGANSDETVCVGAVMVKISGLVFPEAALPQTPK